MSLAQRSVRSSAYNVSANLIQTVIVAFRSIILARLLVPEDFGVYTFISSIIILTSSIPNFGMSSAYVHHAKESEGEGALRVYFSLSIIFNLGWAIFLAVFAWFFIAIENRLIFFVILATQILDNLARVGQVQLMKQVLFRRIAFVNVAIAIGTTISAIWLAWKGYHVWSLVSTDILEIVIVLVGFYTFRPIWRPRLGWSTQIVRYFLDFGRRSFLAELLGQAIDRVDDLWTGIFKGGAALGFYSRAYMFASYPRKILAAPLNTVAGSTYAELKDQPEPLSHAFFRVNAFLIRSGFFLAGLFALIAPEFIYLVIGEKWLPMLTPFRLMLIYTLLDPIKGTVANLFISVGYPEKVVRARAIQLIVLFVGLFLLGPRWDIAGVALAVDGMLVVGIALLLGQARAYVQFSLKRLFVAPTLSLLMALIISFLVMILTKPINNYWLSGLEKTITFSLTYAVILFLLERDQILILWDTFRRIWFGDRFAA